MANLADPRSIRKYVGLDEDAIPDSALRFFIEEADHVVFEDVAIQVIDEQLSGKTDGNNSTFSTGHKYIADTDFDCRVSSNEVDVYAWGTKGSLDTREKWGVSSIDPYEGKIYLSSIPASTYDCMTINYYYYKTKPVYYLLKRAANFWAAFEYITSEYLLIPIRYRRGALSFTHAKPYKDLLDRYDYAINMFNKEPFAKKKYESIKMEEKYIEEYP